MRDSALVVRRPGECQYFVDPGCEVAADTVTFTPEITAVRLVSSVWQALPASLGLLRGSPSNVCLSKKSEANPARERGSEASDRQGPRDHQAHD